MPAKLVSKSHLKTGWGNDIGNPSVNVIVEVIQAMFGGDNSFVILNNRDDNFMLLAGMKSLVFCLNIGKTSKDFIARPKINLWVA